MDFAAFGGMCAPRPVPGGGVERFGFVGKSVYLAAAGSGEPKRSTVFSEGCGAAFNLKNGLPIGKKFYSL